MERQADQIAGLFEASQRKGGYIPEAAEFYDRYYDGSALTVRLCSRHMLPNDKYPVAQRETLIRIVRDRSIERGILDRDARMQRLPALFFYLYLRSPRGDALPPQKRTPSSLRTRGSLSLLPQLRSSGWAAGCRGDGAAQPGLLTACVANPSSWAITMARTLRHHDALRPRRSGKFQPMARHQLFHPVQMFRRYLPTFD